METQEEKNGLKPELTPGERIKAARLSCGMSQEQMVRAINERLGMTLAQPHLSRWENGIVTPNPALVLWIEKYASHQKRWRSRKANAARKQDAA